MMRTFGLLFWFTAAASIVSIYADFGDLQFKLHEQRLPKPLSDHTATKVESKGAVYIVGGCDSTQGNVWNAESKQFECGSLSGSIYEFDDDTLEYKVAGQLSSPRDRHATVNINDEYLWILGGRDASYDLVDTVDAYEIATGKLYTFSLPEEYKTSDHAGFGNNEYAYFAGGYGQNYTIKSRVFRIDSAASIQNAKGNNNELVIEDMQNMLVPRADIQGTTAKSEKGRKFAIVAGGWGALGFCQPLASTEKYSIEEDVWSELPPLQQGTADKTIINFLHFVVAFGGEQHDSENVDCIPGGKTLVSTDLEIFRQDISEWIKQLELPQPRFRFASVPFDDKNQVLTFGGQLAYDETCDCYPTTDTIVVHYDAQYHSHPHEDGEEMKNNSNNANLRQFKAAMLAMVISVMLLSVDTIKLY